MKNKQNQVKKVNLFVKKKKIKHKSYVFLSYCRIGEGKRNDVT